ncbi:MAG: DMT family transporter [Burkholderiaceae bacterium]
MTRALTSFASLPPTARGLLWSAVAGLLFNLLNTTLRAMSLQLDPMQVAFLRNVFGLLAVLPFFLRRSAASIWPRNPRGMVWRGIAHTIGLLLWFSALPHLPLADTTAIGFTGPIFIMLGAAWFLGEKLVAARWIAAGIGFVGVFVVVGPKLAGSGGVWNLVMISAAPAFAASFLIAKSLTRHDNPSVIVFWQAVMVAALSMPLALMTWRWPSAAQWGWFALTGMLGSAGHWCLTRSYAIADISATQPVKFLDLIWASILGFLVFGDRPALSTFIGGTLIVAATIWIARREAGARKRAAG